MSLPNTEIKENINSKERDIISEPPMYKTLLLNDDYTTMEFVVQILMNIFNKAIEDATVIMLDVHKNGKGLCGIYTYEVAETKMGIVHAEAQKNGFPLKCTIEEL